MAIIKPFKALRPNLEQVSKVAALPYDVVTTREARQIAKDNKYSFLHRIYAIAYRLFFMFVVKVLSVPKLTFLKRKMRKYLSYQKLIDSK